MTILFANNQRLRGNSAPYPQCSKISRIRYVSCWSCNKKMVCNQRCTYRLKKPHGSPFPGLKEVCMSRDIWDSFYQQQTNPIHTVAFYLDLANIDVVFTREAQIEVFAFLKQYIQCGKETWVGVTEDFFHFRERQSKFYR